MSHYHAPLRDMQFVLDELLGVPLKLKQLPPWAELDSTQPAEPAPTMMQPYSIRLRIEDNRHHIR